MTNIKLVRAFIRTLGCFLEKKCVFFCFWTLCLKYFVHDLVISSKYPCKLGALVNIAGIKIVF